MNAQYRGDGDAEYRTMHPPKDPNPFIYEQEGEQDAPSEEDSRNA